MCSNSIRTKLIHAMEWIDTVVFAFGHLFPRNCGRSSCSFDNRFRSVRPVYLLRTQETSGQGVGECLPMNHALRNELSKWLHRNCMLSIRLCNKPFTYQELIDKACIQ